MAVAVALLGHPAGGYTSLLIAVVAGLYAAQGRRLMPALICGLAALLTVLAFLETPPSWAGLAWLVAGVALLHAEFLWPTFGVAGLLGVTGAAWALAVRRRRQRRRRPTGTIVLEPTAGHASPVLPVLSETRAMKTVAALAAFCTTLFTAGCSREMPPTFADDLAAITAYNERYLKSINEEDIAALSSLTTDGHVMLPPNREPVVGKAANDALNGSAFERCDFSETWTPDRGARID